MMVLRRVDKFPRLKQLCEQGRNTRLRVAGLIGLIAFLGGFLIASLGYSFLSAAFYPSDNLRHMLEIWFLLPFQLFQLNYQWQLLILVPSALPGLIMFGTSCILLPHGPNPNTR